MCNAPNHRSGRVVVARLDNGPTAAQAVEAFSARPSPAILESVAGTKTSGRWSIFAAEPSEIIVVEPDSTGDPFDAIATALARFPQIENPTMLPFVGGWIGYISYEAGTQIERIRTTNPAGDALPLVRLGLYDSAAIYEHHSQTWHLVAVDWTAPLQPGRQPAAERIEHMRKRLLLAKRQEPAAATARTEPPLPDWTKDQYIARVLRAKEYIAAGDIYQVNLTQRFVSRTEATAAQLYRALRAANPADYAAYLTWDDKAVLSSSPELFLELRDGRVVTRPIKGTRPRGVDPATDAIRREELAASEKDRAELNMIVDLLRNDLGRVCEIGSIRVESAGDLETHPTVFHRVATITGRLNVNTGPIDLLRATSPGGSITGAPKIRAMQIIDELEAVRRGVYCGSIGFIGLDGAMTMNIAIRTMILDRGGLSIRAGGAIVADSDPAEEHAETLAKAAGMFRALRQDTDIGASRSHASSARP